MGALTDWVAAYAQSGTARFHMPGHKGHNLDLLPLGGRFDLTEIDGADQLFAPEGLLQQLELRYSRLYDCPTVISAGGSTLCIQAMLSLACRPRDRILAARNAHVALINACVLLDLTPQWLFSPLDPQSGLAKQPTAAEIALVLEQNPDLSVVYLTSPDYIGQLADIRAISAVCRSHGAKLLVDGAHGAHLRFLEPNQHPIALGADFCCTSAHKTLPVLTGGALLHARRAARAQMKARMGLFGSTSPSYLVLQSLDLAADALEQDPYAAWQTVAEHKRQAAQWAERAGLSVFDTADCAKLTLDGLSAGYDGPALGAHLRAHRVEPEYVSNRQVVLMLSPDNAPQDYQVLQNAFQALMPRAPIQPKVLPLCRPEQVLSPRQAAFAPQTELPVQQAVGRICAANRILCPPGVPILVAGERVSAQSIEFFKQNNITALTVVDA